MHIRILISHHMCLLTSFISRLDIKALIDYYIVCVNYGIVFILNDLLHLITGGELSSKQNKFFLGLGFPTFG